MNISSASLTDALPMMASAMKEQDLQMQISVAVLKKVQDQQEQYAQSLIKMMSQSFSLDGTGGIVNVSA
jgi:hypothetical protein